jgi:periodic tryptophan protein 1
MIAAVCWVPRGAAKPVPQPIEPPSAEEIRELILRHDLEVEVVEVEEEEGEHDEDGHRTAAKSDLASMYVPIHPLCLWSFIACSYVLLLA